MASGSKPADARMPMPTRSASCSFSRVKLICDWIARLWAAEMAPMVASEPTPATAPSRMAARVAAVETRLARDWFSRPRAMWRCVTCATSWASTAASSLSVAVSSSRPVCMPTNPPGSANALIDGSGTRKKLKLRLPSCARLESLRPRDCRYSPISGSSRMLSRLAQAAHRPCARCGTRPRASAWPGPAVPMSGSWSCTLDCARQRCRQQQPARAAAVRRGPRPRSRTRG